MTTNSLIVVATDWGPQRGGINAFNHDFVKSLGFAFQSRIRVICVVPKATDADVADAARSFVELRRLNRDTVKWALESGDAADIIGHVSDAISQETVWVGHDVFTGSAAVAASNQTGTKAALLSHMSYLSYKAFESGSAVTAERWSQDQRQLFSSAHYRFAVGPLLRDELSDLVRGCTPIMLIPGLPEVEPAVAPTRWTMVLFGRLNSEANRLKQGRLAIAAFARAYRHAREQPGLPKVLREPRPRLKLYGVEAKEELEIREFAALESGAALDILPLPYTTDRQHLMTVLSEASVAVMPSWHDGFGLVGWEAIGAGVPLVLGKETGLFRFLHETLGGSGTGCVHGIDIRGSEAQDSSYQEDDVVALTRVLESIAANKEDAKGDSLRLRAQLTKYTWTNCASEFVQGLGWDIRPGANPPALPQCETSLRPLSSPPRLSLPSSNTPLLTLPPPVWRPGLGHAESILLRADEACVPFDAARTDALDSLLDWTCRPDGYPLMVQLIIGEGGVGKTRLLLEVCRRLNSDWVVGFLDNTATHQETRGQFRTLLSQHANILVVIDYAEARREELAALVESALPFPNSRVRIVLLARDGGDWWERLAIDFPKCERVFAGTATSGPFPLPPLYLATESRDVAYGNALLAFATRLNITDFEHHTLAPPDLSAHHFGSPLYIQMAALLALRGERSVTASGLADGLLRHEERYWMRLMRARRVQLADNAPTYLLAFATLAGGIASPTESLRFPWHAAGLGKCDFAITSLFHMIADLYPGGGRIEPFRPDLLGEALVARVLTLGGNLPAALFEHLLGVHANEPGRRHALTLLTRLVRSRPSTKMLLLGALRANFEHCICSIVAVSLETGYPLPAIAATAFGELPLETQNRVASKLRSAIPRPTERLADLAVGVEERLLERSRVTSRRHKTDPAHTGQLARNLISTGVRLADAGRFDGAAQLATEACKLLRSLLIFPRLKPVDEDEPFQLNDPALYVTDWRNPNTSTVVSFCNELTTTHAPDDLRFLTPSIGASATQEAYEHLERLEEELALALNNLSCYLGELERRQEALDSIRESYAIYVRLAKKSPNRHDDGLAMSLRNLSVRLGAMGQFQEALDRVLEAFEIFHRLAQQHPEQYDDKDADTLVLVANRLSDLGHYDECVDKARKGHAQITKRRQAEPDKHEGTFATSLAGLAAHLCNANQYEEGLALSQLAIDTFAPLIKARPNRHAKAYVACLSNRALFLHHRGKYREGLALANQSSDFAVRLAQGHTDRYVELRPTAFRALVTCLADSGSLASARLKASEVCELVRQLSARYPKFLPALLRDELRLFWLAWLSDTVDEGILSLHASWNARAAQAEMLEHERNHLLAGRAVVEGCYLHAQAARQAVEAMGEFLQIHQAARPHQRHLFETDQLIATGYLFQHAPDHSVPSSFAELWTAFRSGHGNSVPITVIETLKRLNCTLPLE